MTRRRVTPPRVIASGLGLGFAPAAPGTVASAAAALAGVGLAHLSPWLLATAAFAATLAGLWALWREPVRNDPGWVVIDEIAGQWFALLGAGTDPLAALGAFALFRLLDIAKPGPVGWADRQPGAFGVMADDVIAGLLTAPAIALLRLAWMP